MRRLKQTRLRTFLLRPKVVTKDNEGVPVITFGDGTLVRGEIWPATSRRQVEQYGDRISGIQNMRVVGEYTITSNDAGVSVTFEDGTIIRPGDGVHVYRDAEQEPDYKVLSVTQYYPLRMEVEARA